MAHYTISTDYTQVEIVEKKCWTLAVPTVSSVHITCYRLNTASLHVRMVCLMAAAAQIHISHAQSRKCQTTVHRAAPNSAPSVRSPFHTTLPAPAQFQVAAGFLQHLRAPANITITLYSKLQYPVPITSCPYATQHYDNVVQQTAVPCPNYKLPLCYPTRHEVVGKRWKRNSTYLKQRNDQRHVWTIFIFLYRSRV
jgi:hypothetical protein